MFSWCSEPTLFVSKPRNLKVIRGSEVTFECAVKSDLSTPVTTTWLKNRRPLTLNWRCGLLTNNMNFKIPAPVLSCEKQLN